MGTGKETSSRELRTWFGDFPNAIGNAIGALLTTCLNFAVVLTVPQCILHRQRRRVSEAGDDVAVDVISSGQSPAASRQRMAWRGTQAASSSVRRSAPALVSVLRPYPARVISETLPHRQQGSGSSGLSLVNVSIPLLGDP